MLQQAHRHGRHRAPALHPLGLDQPEHLRGVESARVEDDPAARDGLGQQGGERADVKERRADQVHRLRSVYRQQVRQLPGAGQHVVLVGHHRTEGQLHGLGHSRTARGEQDGGRVVLIGRAGNLRQSGLGAEAVPEVRYVEHRNPATLRQAGRVGDDGAWRNHGKAVRRLVGAPPAVAEYRHRAHRPDRP